MLQIYLVSTRIQLLTSSLTEYCNHVMQDNVSFDPSHVQEIIDDFVVLLNDLSKLTEDYSDHV